MAWEAADQSIRTRRLALVSLTVPFVRALVDGDLSRAGGAIGASVGRWFATEPAHFVQLSLAQAGDGATTRGLGRAIVLAAEPGRRHVIGSIGFHGPPDDRGRLEVGCVIHPAHRGRGYAGEAMAAMFDWAAASLGVTRFLVLVSPTQDQPSPFVELTLHESGPSIEELDALAPVLEASPGAGNREGNRP